VAGVSVGGVVGAGAGFDAGIVVLLAPGVDLEVTFRVFRPLGVAGVITSAGAGPASAGFATSAPTAAAGAADSDFRDLLLLVARPGVNEQGCAGSTDDNVSRSADLRPLNDTIVGVAVASPICKATAV